MSNVSIHIEPATLNAVSGRQATAVMWLEINGSQFPNPKWNDCIVIVLSWWTLGILQMLSGRSTQEMLFFMEGPYAVEVTILPSGMLRFRALEAWIDEIAAGEEPATPFILGLISQSREILGACKQLGWWSKDAETLQSSLEALSEKTKELPR